MEYAVEYDYMNYIFNIQLYMQDCQEHRQNANISASMNTPYIHSVRFARKGWHYYLFRRLKQNGKNIKVSFQQPLEVSIFKKQTKDLSRNANPTL